MPSPLPPTPVCPVCPDAPVNIPGTPGSDGAAGAAGAAGKNAYTTLSAQFTMPAEGAVFPAAVVNSAWAVVGQVVYVGGLGWMQVTSVPTATSVMLLNLKSTAGSLYLSNVAPGTIAAIGQKVSPGGLQGPSGTAITGPHGVNGYTKIAVIPFTIPPEQDTATATVEDSTWMAIGQVVYIPTLGYLEVTGKPNAAQVTLLNLRNTVTGTYLSNAVPPTSAGVGQMVSPAGTSGQNLDTPVGMVMPYAGSTIPTGWLDCDGSAVSRTTYAALFSALGTVWGIGDNVTTFNLPDLRGRAVVGVGTGAGLTARTLGTSFGAETHALTAPEEAWHSHWIGWIAPATPANVNMLQANVPYAHPAVGYAFQKIESSGITNDITTGSENLTLASTRPNPVGERDGDPHNNMQPSAALKYVIKT